MVVRCMMYKGVRIFFLIFIFVISISFATIEYSQWDQYMGNPGRSAYIECKGPDFPEILWESELPGYPEIITISDGQAIVLYRKENLPYPETGIALIDVLTGIVREESLAGVTSLESVYPVQDILMGMTHGGWIYRIDPVSGEVKWDIKNPDTAYPDPEYMYPVILPDKIIFPTHPVICRAVNDFNILWDLESTQDSHIPYTGTTSIAASRKRVHIVLKTGNTSQLLTVKSDSGQLLWSKELNLQNIVTNGPLLFGYQDTIYAWDAETGDLKWTYELESINSNMLAGPDYVCVADDSHIFSLDTHSGVLLWKAQRGESSINRKGLPIPSHIVGTNNSVIWSDIFDVTCFSPRDGSQLWNIHLQDSVDSRWQNPCPAIIEGILIVNGKEHSDALLAITSDPQLFAQQGDAFLSRELPDKAVESYKKASELYERMGNHEKAQEMGEKISQLESSLEPIIPSKIQFLILPLSLILGIVIISTFLYVFVIQKRSKN